MKKSFPSGMYDFVGVCLKDEIYVDRVQIAACLGVL